VRVLSSAGKTRRLPPGEARNVRPDRKMSTSTHSITFTKNKQTGAYDVIGPEAAMREGYSVEVTKKDGTITIVTLGRVSRPFTAKFGPCAGMKVAIASVIPSASDLGRVRQPVTSYSTGTRECSCGKRSGIWFDGGEWVCSSCI
jgi:hypothetical protein